MQSAEIGRTLREHRVAQRVSRVQLAALAGVSVRLVAEFERGARPHVSLETALRLLRLLGVSLQTARAADADAAAARAARAETRRATWQGHVTTLSESETAPNPPRAVSARIAGVTEASALAHALAQQPKTVRPRRGSRGARHAG
jgi:transcriptional regulator with XRE-family HTH domain